MEAPKFNCHELGDLEHDESGVYTYEAFRYIEWAFLNLFEDQEFRERIESGYYDLLLSDEKSGRIPTLILRKLADRMNDKKLRTFFIASGQLSHEKGIRYGHDPDLIEERLNFQAEEQYENEIAAHLEKISGRAPGQRALIVTEFIDTGDSLRHLVRAAHAAGIDADIVTLAAREDFDDFDRYRYEKLGFDDQRSEYGPPHVYIAKSHVDDLVDRAEFFHPFHEKQLEPYRPTVRRNENPQRSFSAGEKAAMLQEVFPEGEYGQDFSLFNLGFSTGDDGVDMAIETFLEKEKGRPYSEEELQIMKEREQAVNSDIDLLVERLLE